MTEEKKNDREMESDHGEMGQENDGWRADGDLSGLVRKAKRKSLLRSAVIAASAAVLVLGGALIANLQLLYKSSDNALRDISLFKQISGPNSYEGGYRVDFGLLTGKLDIQTYKLIEGVPVVQGAEPYEYNVLGHFSKPAGGYNLGLPDAFMKEEKLDYMRPYNPNTGEREMLFYLPDISYPRTLNELPQLEAMDPDKLVELAVSFDKAYTVKEIGAMLPPDAHPVWYWVDTYSNRYPYEAKKMPDGSSVSPFPDSEAGVYGFGMHPDTATNTAAEEDFLKLIQAGLSQKGKYEGEYKRIYDYLRKDKPAPLTSDVRIWGVVVTGTAENLKALNGKPYLKAAVFGAIADRY
ncbi:anti sigma factor C-terminal domain-containing protein [Paenibacillus humicus]|uniref:anti-sigma factor n=1 Tax=Paenibacillus humicus TaxID=412861 RepID=UPI003F16777C